MSRRRADSFISQGPLSGIRQRALWLAKLNSCMERQLPLSINTVVKLVNVDTRHRAVIHVKGGEWATQVRLQQRLILAILKTCGVPDLKGVVVKNRPLKNLAEEDVEPKRVKRPMSQSTRDLVETSADSVTDERLAQSLRRLAHKRV